MHNMLTRKRKTDIDTQNIQKNATNYHRLDSSQDSDSEETSSSQTSIPFNAESWCEVKKKLKNLAWIQCDNPDCRKWRKIPNELLKNIAESDKWFCHQNRDPAFSSCSVPEEDVQWYDQMADRSGLKYLKSQLSPGDVVWAKMDGYCSWPSVVTAEPGTGSGHLSRYEDGEIAFYHVEFLGQPHSHGWVNTKHITVFTPASVGKQQVSSVSHKKQGRGRKSKGSGRKGSGRKHKTFCIQPAQKLKTAYKTGVCVEDGISEAMTMLPLSPSKRLDMCTYVQALPESDSGCNLAAGMSSETSVLNQKQTKKSEIVSSTVDKPDIPVSKFTSFNNCLENKTKEERLMLDVEMYRQNERAFVHDVTRFLVRNGLKPCKGPFWQNQSISLFQLFLAVHERGGYMQVTCKKKWAAVYREMTETPCQKDVNNSCGARLFYYRHLYPYELYIHGEDFTKVVAELKEDTTRQSSQKKKSSVKIKRQKKKKNAVQEQNSHNIGNSAAEPEEDIASDSLREMLQTLEESSKLALGDGLMENEIDITFYDDSTPTDGKLLPLTNFEPQDSPLLMAAAKGKGTSKGEASSSSQQVLHALENVGQTSPQPNEQCPQNSQLLQVVPSATDNADGNSSAQRKRDDNSSAFSQQLRQNLSVLQEAMSLIDHQMD